MRKSLLLLLLPLFLLSSCDFTEPDTGITISGVVVHETTGNPVSGAMVEITNPQILQQSTTTNTEGFFFFDGVEFEEDVAITLRVTRDGFNDRFTQINASPGSNITVSNIQLRPSGNGDDDGTVPGTSGGAASIILTDISRESINIKETGGIVNSTITVQVQDSSGRAIDLTNAVDVEFRIITGPGGEEVLTPETVRTNSNGFASTSLFSGNIAGVVKIEAKVTRTDIALEIKSTPVAITIHGGFPDLAHFSIVPEIYNFEGYNTIGVPTLITALVGDEFSNPVKPGTAVYFNSTGGVIQGSGIGHTNEDGFTSVTLYSGQPRPNHATFGAGYAVVKAVTVNKDDVEIEVETLVLFSGPPTSDNITLNPATFDIPNAGSQSFTLTVTDSNGNPLPFESEITIEASEGLTLDGDDTFVVPNTLFPGDGVTSFNFVLVDADPDTDNQVDAQITVKITTPGGFSASRTFSGQRAKVNP